MDEPVSSWACFDSFDWLALLFLTLRLKKFHSTASSDERSTTCFPRNAVTPRYGEQGSVLKHPHIWPIVTCRQCMRDPHGRSPTWPSELAEAGGAAQNHLSDHENKSCFETQIYTNNAAWPSACLSLDASSAGQPCPVSGIDCCVPYDSTQRLLDALACLVSVVADHGAC